MYFTYFYLLFFRLTWSFLLIIHTHRPVWDSSPKCGIPTSMRWVIICKKKFKTTRLDRTRQDSTLLNATRRYSTPAYYNNKCFLKHRKETPRYSRLGMRFYLSCVLIKIIFLNKLFLSFRMVICAFPSYIPQSMTPTVENCPVRDGILLKTLGTGAVFKLLKPIRKTISNLKMSEYS
jgi:hypothetical protein